MVKRRHKRRLLVDCFKDSLQVPSVLRAAFWLLRIVDIVLRALDRFS